MIVTRTPFRVTLGGGGTDLPSFYERHGGFIFIDLPEPVEREEFLGFGKGFVEHALYGRIYFAG